MKKVVVLLAVLLSGNLFAQSAAYIRGATPPWDEVTNEAAMDQVFGAGNWDDLRMADGAGPFMPAAGYDFIFLEGSDDTSLELDAFLNANRATIENFVSSGGRLLLNAAPNEGGNIDFGFGGILLDYNAGDGFFSEAVTPADPAHPIFNGPFTPVVDDYTGTSFGHAIIDGPVTPIILSNDTGGGGGGGGNPPEASSANRGDGGGGPPVGSTVLAQTGFGSGLLLVGGMTTNNFHDPLEEAANLRANIIFFAVNGSVLPEPPAVPALSSTGLMILLALMIGVLLLARRRAAAPRV